MNKVVALTGSTKFKDTFQEVAKKLTLEGNVVLLPVIYSHADNIELTEEQVYMLEQENIHKMRLAEEIVVINKDNYIGEGLRRELKPFLDTDKTIKFIEPIDKKAVKEEVLKLLKIEGKRGTLEIYGMNLNNFILKDNLFLPKDFFYDKLLFI